MLNSKSVEYTSGIIIGFIKDLKPGSVERAYQSYDPVTTKSQYMLD